MHHVSSLFLCPIPSSKLRRLPRVVTALGLTFALLGSAPSAWAAPSKWLSDSGEITYTVVHKFHEVHGVSPAATVTAVLDDQGLKVMARATVKSFDSGNSSRDAHVQEVTDAAKFPVVTVRALAPGFTLPSAAGVTKLSVKGEVELHGVKTALPIQIEIKLADPKHLSVTFDMTDSLEGHKIERPALLFVKVDDAMRIVGHFNMHAD
jgi:polyisoprenoid-binding protein YceI